MKKIRNIVRLVSRMSFFLLVAETMFANNELNGNGKSDIKPYSGTFTHQASSPVGIQADGFSLVADSGSLQHDLAINITFLPHKSGTDFPSRMVNVTGIGDGVRILPNGVHFGARYYWPPLGHWLSVDPLADKYPGMSPYAYCGWNPIMVIDPNGMDWYDPGDGDITWNDNVTSQEYMDQAGIKGLYLGKNVLVAKHGRDENLNEELNGAIFELYVESHTEGAIATIRGNTIPCDVDKYGTLQEGRYPASYQKYHDMPAILINGGGDLPTVRGNPNNKENYIDYDNKVMKPLTEHIMDEIYFHYGNNYFQGLKDSKGNPWTTGCQTGGNYKGSWDDYKEFMKYVPTTFNGFYYLRPK